MLQSVRVYPAPASWGKACDILDFCLDLVNGVTGYNFNDDVLLVQVNHSNEICLVLCHPQHPAKMQMDTAKKGYSIASTKTACISFEEFTVRESNQSLTFALGYVTVHLITYSTKAGKKSPSMRERMYTHWLTGLLTAIWYNINIPLCFLSICPAVFSQQGGQEADGVLKCLARPGKLLQTGTFAWLTG